MSDSQERDFSAEMKLLQTTDASVWAAEFMRIHGDKLPDEGLMIAWFANMWYATNDPLQAEIERLTAENERAREIATIHGRRADANLEYAKKCEKLLKRLWIQVNGDDVFLQDAIEGQDA